MHDSSNLPDNLFYKKDIFAMRVPSVLVPQEFNVILNPNHKLVDIMKVVEVEAAILDDRLVKF